MINICLFLGAPRIDLGTSWSGVKCSTTELHPHIANASVILCRCTAWWWGGFLIRQILMMMKMLTVKWTCSAQPPVRWKKIPINVRYETMQRTMMLSSHVFITNRVMQQDHIKSWRLHPLVSTVMRRKKKRRLVHFFLFFPPRTRGPGRGETGHTSTCITHWWCVMSL